MSERTSFSASVARYGLTDDRAEQWLRAVDWWGERGPVDSALPVFDTLSRAADPDLALRGLERVRESDPTGWAEIAETLKTDPAFRARFISVLGFSRAFSDFLYAEPRHWRRLQGEGITDPNRYRDVLLEATQLVEPENDGTGEKALRSEYRGLLLEIAATDLGQFSGECAALSYEQISANLTALAEAALFVGVALAQQQNPAADARLAVIAMGKCGGRELNYVSDVDVIFVGAGEIQNATKIASTAMGIVDKACFEVDAALRPEGKAGALVRTLDGHVTYYQKWAHTWEFQALLKARAIVGDDDLGQEYVSSVAPFVWSAAERDNFVADVQQMRRRVEGYVSAELVERELKLGRGGLRDVEFAVQLLQLVHGRVDEELRSPSTLDALEALAAGGYVGRVDGKELAESYRFLRTVEHRLQLRQLRRTHLFPNFSDVEELRIIGKSMGIRPAQGLDPGAILLAEFRRHSLRVRRLHEKLFYQPLLQSVSRVPTEALRLTTKQAAARLNALGYTAPEGALRHIQALTAGISRRAAIQQALLPALLDLLADTPDPDGGLLSYRKVSEALEGTPWYLRVLRDEAAVVERLAFLLGTSKLIPDLLTRAPEVLRLLGKSSELVHRSPSEVATSLLATVRRQPGLDASIAAARSLRRHELLRIATADLLGLIKTRQVCEALSSVWIAVLQGAFAAAVRKEIASTGAELAKIAVIGMGRLGGYELGYGSDADVLFVCAPLDGVSDGEALNFASAVVENLRAKLGAPSLDPALVVDADLRPEGRSGPLVRTLDSYRAYYERWGEVWESQALLRAQFVAGDDELGSQFVDMIDPIRYPVGGLDAVRIREIRRIKARVETERMPKGADPKLHTKLGRGGLADVEWTVQLLQLRHAGVMPALRTTSTPDALTAIAEAGLAKQADVDSLMDAWLLATRTRNACMLVRGKATDQIPSSGRELMAVARICGYSADDDPGEFLDNYLRTTRRAHAVVQRLFYEN